MVAEGVVGSCSVATVAFFILVRGALSRMNRVDDLLLGRLDMAVFLYYSI